MDANFFSYTKRVNVFYYASTTVAPRFPYNHRYIYHIFLENN